MCAKWNPETQPDVVIDAISRIAYVNDEGNAAFRGVTKIEHNLAILVTTLDFHTDIPPSLQRAFMWSAVCEAVKKGRLDALHVKRFVSSREREYLKRPTSRYVLLTGVSIKLPVDILRTRITGVSLTFTRRYPARFDRTNIEPQIRNYVPGKLPNNYAWVRAGTSARSDHEAYDRGLEALDLLRAIWNFNTSFCATRMTWPTRGPVNNIVNAPVHSLHRPSGALASDLFGYEPSYRKPVRPLDLTGKLDKLRAFERRLRNNLWKWKETDFLRRALVRYVRAQDDAELANVFLSLWSVLEMLTDTLKLSYDRTIRRAAFMWDNRALAVQELKHLRSWRNRRVHGGESTEDKEVHVYQLKKYVDTLLGFLLFNPYNSNKNLQEIACFLDLPFDEGVLARRIEMYRQAKELRATDK